MKNVFITKLILRGYIRGIKNKGSTPDQTLTSADSSIWLLTSCWISPFSSEDKLPEGSAANSVMYREK